MPPVAARTPRSPSLRQWGAGVVICLERGANLHIAQLMPLLLTVSCFSKIQIGLPFWYRLTRVVPEKGPLNICVCLCVCVCVYVCVCVCVCVCFCLEDCLDVLLLWLHGLSYGHGSIAFLGRSSVCLCVQSRAVYVCVCVTPGRSQSLTGLLLTSIFVLIYRLHVDKRHSMQSSCFSA